MHQLLIFAILLSTAYGHYLTVNHHVETGQVLSGNINSGLDIAHHPPLTAYGSLIRQVKPGKPDGTGDIFHLAPYFGYSVLSEPNHVYKFGSFFGGRRNNHKDY
ncbi:uncharacterized protein LOC134713845 [Mytilus trossulus]|uniref:uncharacterized protein LOC134713845 n=1 Tax=Mytilus trossulus TaxID=6551 RepID=UPI003006DFCD